MLIGICGALCSGKTSVARFLVERHGFTTLSIDRPTRTPTVEKSASEAHVMPSPDDKTATFKTVSELLAFATEHWTDNYVTTSIWSQQIIDALVNRPFFILLSVDAPISVRWRRFSERCKIFGESPPSLEQFVVRSDEHMYDPVFGLAALPSQARVKLINNTTSLSILYTALDDLHLTDPLGYGQPGINTL